MRILYLAKFTKEFRKLPKPVQELAEKKLEIFRADPFNQRLRTHKLGGALEGFYAFSINHTYRVIFDFADTDIIRFYKVGTHDIYE